MKNNDRKIGEQFRYHGKILKVIQVYSCAQCVFNTSYWKCDADRNITGSCGSHYREDRKAVVFVECKINEDVIDINKECE